jgi:CheY-like chemotaxis protein
MPGMEGIEFIRHARRLLPGVKIVAMSGGGIGQTNELYLYMAKSLGADCVLEKPFRAAVLLETVQSLLPPQA